MDIKKIIIAVDGYSATGKSTFAKLIAKRAGFIHLDSGAFYRAVTLITVENGLIDNRNRIDEEALRNKLQEVTISLEKVEDGDCLRNDIFIDGRNVECLIRGMEISSAVSPVSALAFVRSYVDRLLRNYGRMGGVVMDGRDIGTNVFPDAQLKIFMVADDKVRAQRRYNEMIAAGKMVEFDEVLENLLSRDFIDSHRSVSPLKQAPDSIVLDNTNMNLEEQFVWLCQVVKDKFGQDLV